MNTKLQNRGGYYAMEKKQTKQTQSQPPVRKAQQPSLKNKPFKAFQGKGVRMGNDKAKYNWICKQCGLINKVGEDVNCKNCQFQN